MPRIVVLHQEMNVLLTLLLVQVVLRIVIALLLCLVVGLARMVDHTEVDLELLHLVGHDLVLVCAKYDLPLVLFVIGCELYCFRIWFEKVSRRTSTTGSICLLLSILLRFIS